MSDYSLLSKKLTDSLLIKKQRNKMVFILLHQRQ